MSGRKRHLCNYKEEENNQIIIKGGGELTGKNKWRRRIGRSRWTRKRKRRRIMKINTQL